MNKKFQSKEGKIWPQILTIFLVCLSSITAGALFSWPSPFVVKLTQDKLNYDISEDEATFLIYIHSLAVVAFGVVASKFNDIIGRKKTMFLIAIPQLAFWIITAFAKNIYVFYVARTISGISDAFHYSSVPIYVAEISEPKVRGLWGNILAFVIMGQFLINLIGVNCTVRETSYICLPLPIIFAIAVFFLPESPYYSLMKNREEEAKTALRFFRAKEDIEDEFYEIKAAVERQMSDKSSWKDLILIESNRKALYAAIFLRVSQQFSGIGAFQTYTQFIFEKSGMEISSSLSTLLCSGVFLIFSFSFGYIGEQLGRKKSYTIAQSFCSLILICEGIYFYFDQSTSVEVNFLNWFPLAGLITYLIIASAFGLLSIPTLMSGELFPNNVKTKAFGVQLILMGGLIVIGSVVFYELNSMFGLTAPFLFFGTCSVVSSVLAMFLVPETKGKTLEEIQKSLMKKSKQRNFV